MEDIEVLKNIINELNGETHYLLYTNKEKVQAIENLIYKNKELEEKRKNTMEVIGTNYIHKDKVRDLIQDIDEALYITKNNEARFYLKGFKNSINDLL